MSPGPSETNTAQALLLQFSSAQSIRALNYMQLDKGFEALLRSHNETDYKYADKLLLSAICGHAVVFYILLTLQGSNSRGGSSFPSVLRDHQCS